MPRACRETSEALNGPDWVGAGIKARVLLADAADEIDRLRARVAELERDAARLDAIDSGEVEVRRGTMRLPTAPGRPARTIPAWEVSGPGGTVDVAAYLREAIDRATEARP